MSNQDKLINIILESPDFDNEFEAKACAERIVDAGWVHESEIEICKECGGHVGVWYPPRGLPVGSVCAICRGNGWVRKEMIK